MFAAVRRGRLYGGCHGVRVSASPLRVFSRRHALLTTSTQARSGSLPPALGPCRALLSSSSPFLWDRSCQKLMTHRAECHAERCAERRFEQRSFPQPLIVHPPC